MAWIWAKNFDIFLLCPISKIRGKHFLKGCWVAAIYFDIKWNTWWTVLLSFYFLVFTKLIWWDRIHFKTNSNKNVNFSLIPKLHIFEIKLHCLTCRYIVLYKFLLLIFSRKLELNVIIFVSIIITTFLLLISDYLLETKAILCTDFLWVITD